MCQNQKALWNQQVRNNRIIPSNKPDNIIHDDKQGSRMLRVVAIPGDRNLVKKEAEKILKYTRPHNINSAHVERESESDTGNTGGDWNHFKITQTVPEQHNWRERYQGTTENSHTGGTAHKLREVLM